jgi:hypothetical protein
MAGTATEVVVDQHDLPDTQATISLWFLECPGQTPFWDKFILAIIHLRPIKAVRAAHVSVPHATHEVLLVALDPDSDPRADDPDSWHHLLPVNVVEQIELPDDEAAAVLLGQCAAAVLDGHLWAEPPLSGQLEPWRTAVLKTAAHHRGEAHAP